VEKYLVKDLPFPYTSKAQFERRMEVPAGHGVKYEEGVPERHHAQGHEEGEFNSWRTSALLIAVVDRNNYRTFDKAI